MYPYQKYLGLKGFIYGYLRAQVDDMEVLGRVYYLLGALCGLKARPAETLQAQGKRPRDEGTEPCLT